MILYCIICYLVMLGMIIEDEKKNGKYKYAWLSFLASPFLLPIIIGMKLEEQNKKEK